LGAPHLWQTLRAVNALERQYLFVCAVR
jgi:hypothetical protein